MYDGSEQQWPIRIGSGLATLVMALVKLAIGAGMTQQMWSNFRRKAYTLDEIDKVFSLPNGVTGIFSLDVLDQAKIVALMAVILW